MTHGTHVTALTDSYQIQCGGTFRGGFPLGHSLLRIPCARISNEQASINSTCPSRNHIRLYTQC